MLNARFDTASSSPGARRNRQVAGWLGILVCATLVVAWLAGNTGSAANAPRPDRRSIVAQTAGRLAPNNTYTVTFAPLATKPYGIQGVINELNISVWGPYSWRSGGDAYSPQYDPP